MKYRTTSHGEIADTRKKINIGVANGEPVYLYEDGSIEATSFTDVSKGGVNFEVDHKSDSVSFVEKIDNDISIKYTPNSIKKIYEVVSKKAYELINVYGKIVKKVKPILKDLKKWI